MKIHGTSFNRGKTEKDIIPRKKNPDNPRVYGDYTQQD
jgi:hypothetical protein